METEKKRIERQITSNATRDYFEGTLTKATKITHGMGIDSQNKPIVQTYQPFHKDFAPQGIKMAQQLLLIYFQRLWGGENSSLVIDGDVVNNQNLMEIADKYWKYTMTDVHFVEVWHA